MTKIKFTSGIIEKIDSEYYNLTLFNGVDICYKATIETDYAATLINKYDNKKIKLIS